MCVSVYIRLVDGMEQILIPGYQNFHINESSSDLYIKFKLL